MPPFEINADRDHRDPDDDALVMVPLNYFNHAVYEQPPGYRAWALQERVMATRVVSFGLGELFWDCAQLPNAMALSAIAHDIGKAMNDVYIAGHFWKTLPGSLNWVLTDSPPPRSDPEKATRLFWSEKPGAEDDGPRTPSWSWASMDSPVFGCRGGLPLPQLADAVSYTLELANDANPTGTCTSASISIRAYCAEIEWQSQNEPAMLARTEAWACEDFDLDLDETEVIRVEGSQSLIVALSEDEERQEWAGLVVERVPHEGRIAYRRIDHFSISGEDVGGSTWWDERISIFGGEKRLLELV
ncbi:hypothetical protein INS49_003419 [Diaporthe citri]|uniref:uncharacterized protein n=1 Tax=Diaporthe citri TaxID=83186 RepID=UPI001C7E8BD7|nr:uncharacterized protein INS49_003419 [Diaporthe citri]KAG6355457.1 hypothetical protein INS49_003419 [Diaporthe citri]